MSYQIGAFCYGTPEGAANAAASSQAGAVVSIGSASYGVDVAAVSASSITYTFSDVSSTSSFQKVVPFTPVPCGLLDTADGLVMGWSIALCWLAVAGVLFLRRGLQE
jgi:hypothetical protein